MNSNNKDTDFSKTLLELTKLEDGIQRLKSNIHTLTLPEKKKLYLMLKEFAIKKARVSFESYVELMVEHFIPDNFIKGVHINYLCRELQLIEHKTTNKECCRLQISLPPGSMKTVLMNLFISWCFGRHPEWRVLHIGHSTSLIEDVCGGPIRDLIWTPEYMAIFPDTIVKRDKRAAGRWYTTRKGVYYGAGAAAQIAGRRATLAVIDDAMSEQTALSKVEREKVNRWYMAGLRSRLLPFASEVAIGTRWHTNDILGYLQELDGTEDNPKKGSRRPWRVIAIPAILDEKNAELLGLEKGKSYWPEYKTEEMLNELKRSSTAQEWAALYQQNPVVEEGNIFKQKMIKRYTGNEPPKGIYYILISVDTAFSTKTTADFSAFGVWGVFDRIERHPTTGRELKVPNIILIDFKKGRWDFDSLCRELQDAYDAYVPDAFLVEKAGSGITLIQEFTRRGMPVTDYKHGGIDKVTRAHACSPIMSSGRVWFPATKQEGSEPKLLDFADELETELLQFPNGKHDDGVDVTTSALIWMRDTYTLSNQNYRNELDADSYDVEKPKKEKYSYWALASGNA